MFNDLDLYLKAVFQERQWSWSLVAILLVAAGLLVRAFALGPFVRRAKTLDRSSYSVLKNFYFRRSLIGWIFFGFSVLFGVILWRSAPEVPFGPDALVLVLGLAVSFLLGLIFHLLALATAAVKVLQRLQEAQQPSHAHQKNHSLS